MINSHQFKDAAKKFRAGRLSLSEFSDLVLDDKPPRKPNEAASFRKPANTDKPSANTVVSLLRQLRDRPSDAHKGDFGRVLAIGGSQGMAGSISLTGVSALRSGTGMVKVAVPETIQALVAANNPCLMTIGCLAEGDYFHGASESSLSHFCEWADVVAFGPGIGRGEAQQWIASNLYAKTPQPLVVDADGLNALADCDDLDLSEHAGQRILTPHAGEFCRLINQQLTNRDQLEARAIEFASQTRAVVVLKGNRTLVTDGAQTFHNTTGNPGMATAGSGDVLTGVIASFLGQGFSPFEASILGAHLHGKAGDEAANRQGATSMIATDILDCLAHAICDRG